MKHYFQSGLVLVAGVLGAAAATGHADQNPTAVHPVSDIRQALLRHFLWKTNTPIRDFADTFIAEADAHHLDWRLLPSLAIVESGGGQRNRRNNLFGWNNGASRFVSATEAIHHVAQALSEARPYKGKDLRGKLAAYNPNPDYLRSVMGVMHRISPVPVPEAL
jgi:hypothetical protein